MANNYGFTFGELNDSSANDGYGGLFVKFLNTVGSNSAGTKQPALLFDMRDTGTPIDWSNITSPLIINGNGLAINSDSAPTSGYALHINSGNLKVESSSNNTQLELLATGGTNQTFKIFSATSSNSSGAGLHFQDATADTIPLSIKSSNGYVGIGTTSPQDSLHLNGNIRLASDSIIWAASGTHDHNNGNLKLRSGGNGTGDPVDVHSWSGTGAELEIDGDYDEGYFRYTHNSSNKFHINGGNGYVGIGTTSPGAGLHVVNNGKNIRMEGTDHCYMEFYPDGNAAGRKGYFGYESGSATAITLRNEMGGFRFQGVSGHTYMIGNRDNHYNVGYGADSYNFRKILFEVSDNNGSSDSQIYFIRNDSWKSHTDFSSDSRIKENIVEYPPADSLNIVKNIKVKKYYQTQEKKECRGFIAQEITDYVPEAVSIHDLKDEGLLEDYHMLDYRRVLVHSFGAIQELDRINTEQAQRIQTLETQLADVVARLTALENA